MQGASPRGLELSPRHRIWDDVATKVSPVFLPHTHHHLSEPGADLSNIE